MHKQFLAILYIRLGIQSCLVLFILLFFALPSVNAQYTVHLDTANYFTLAKHPKVYQTTDELSLAQILALDSSAFKPYQEIEFSTGHTYWGYFTAKNTYPYSTDYMLNIGWYNNYTSIFIERDGEFIERRTGSREDLSTRDLPEFRVNATRIHLPYDKEIRIYIKFKSLDGRLPGLSRPTFVRQQAFYQRINDKDLIQGAFQGIMWIMILYNLFIFWYSKDKAYLSYALYMVCVAAYFMYYNGYAKRIFFPESTYGEEFLWILSTGFTSVFYYYFLRYFLDTRKIIPKVNRIIQYWIYIRLGLIALCVVLVPMNVYPTLNLITLVLAGLETLFGAYIFAKLLQTKQKLARFFVVGGIAFMLGMFAGVISYQFSTGLYVFFYETGAVIEILAFSLGLGYRIKVINEEKQQAQANLLHMQKEMTQELEHKVKARTQMLRDSNEELQQTVDKLDDTNEMLNKRNVQINAQHSKIQSSIQYAKRIQDAMLPSESRLQSIFADSFTFFMPRDVVSGDFYWVSLPESTTGRIVFAVVDCTGHGVPGAFMSLVGDGHLNQIVNIHGIYEPADILSHLDVAIQRTLNQQENNNKDGMDMAICTYDPQLQRLDFAGAKNPIAIFQGGELQFIKGAKHCIGGNDRNQAPKNFTQHQIDVSKPTSFYMFTDGYQDQFGGEKDKKFMISSLKKLLTDIHLLPCDEQHQVLQQRILAWMNPTGKNMKQTDDILVLGAKI